MRLDKFFRNLQQDIKTFIFFLLLICLFRIAFICFFHDSLDASTANADIIMANLAGMRLSMKSAGAIMAVGFISCTVIGGLIFPRINFYKLRLTLGGIGITLLTILFCARFPYYKLFHAGFGAEIAEGLQDDHQAIFSTMLDEYQLIPRLAAAILLSFVIFMAYRRVIRTRTFGLPNVKVMRHSVLAWISMLVFVLVSFFFIRFGGSFSYTHSLNWENAGITGDTFLNEMILDDLQGLYRAQSIYKRMKTGKIEYVDPENIRDSLRLLSDGNQSSDKVSGYITHIAKGAKIKKPRHIFIILGESWAEWPLLPKYEGLHVADGLKSLMQRPDAYHTDTFMPNGEFTMIGITGVVTGLSEVGIRVNNRPRTFNEVYPTSMAPQFKSLGYNVDFWYGGYPSWDNIKRTVLAQGFDHFWSCPDFGGTRQSIWGTTDENIFGALSSHINDEAPTVHVIMTVSNHPPYNLDLAAEGFDTVTETNRIKEIMPEVKNPEELAVELGHYWYMDKVVTAFVNATLEKYPDSLFVITGDHAVRMDPGPNTSLYEHQAVPFVIVGDGISADYFAEHMTGGHTAIAPTLIELIAPEGFEYVSIARSMTLGAQPAFNRNVWLTNRAAGNIADDKAEDLAGMNGDYSSDKESLLPWIRAMRTASWQLIMKGDNLDG